MGRDNTVVIHKMVMITDSLALNLFSLHTLGFLPIYNYATFITIMSSDFLIRADWRKLLDVPAYVPPRSGSLNFKRRVLSVERFLFLYS